MGRNEAISPGIAGSGSWVFLDGFLERFDPGVSGMVFSRTPPSVRGLVRFRRMTSTKTSRSSSRARHYPDRGGKPPRIACVPVSVRPLRPEKSPSETAGPLFPGPWPVEQVLPRRKKAGVTQRSRRLPKALSEPDGPRRLSVNVSAPKGPLRSFPAWRILLLRRHRPPPPQARPMAFPALSGPSASA